jgi:FKBP-type peptidyl-prolyl cis-trans isomerase
MLGRGWPCTLLQVLLVGVASAGCATTPPGPDLAALTYAPELSVDPAAMEELPSGLFVRELAPGSGPGANRGHDVLLHYVGSFPDGTVFDSSLERDEPVRFRLGDGMVIRGWEEGIRGMQPGGSRQLVVPPHLGYGRQGVPGHIPPDQVLVFELRLLEVR